MWHSQLELASLGVLAGVAGRWPTLDRLAVALADNELLKTVPYLLVLVGFWHCRGAKRRRAARREVLAGIVAAGAAAIASRVIQNGLSSVRPVWDPVYGALFPGEFQRVIRPEYHSFPSDHVALLVPLAWTVGRLDPRLGALGAGWLAVLVLVRVYLGLHYPIDVLGGALLGLLAVAAVGGLPRALDAAALGVRSADRRWPAATSATLFLIAFQYATLFEAVRDLAGRFVHVLAMLR